MFRANYYFFNLYLPNSSDSCNKSECRCEWDKSVNSVSEKTINDSANVGTMIDSADKVREIDSANEETIANSANKMYVVESVNKMLKIVSAHEISDEFSMYEISTIGRMNGLYAKLERSRDRKYYKCSIVLLVKRVSGDHRATIGHVSDFRPATVVSYSAYGLTHSHR